MKVGLYSITYLGIWYRGGHVPLRELIPKVKALGFDGLEIDLKRPHGFPLDLDQKARAEIKELSESKGIEIPAVAGNNNFASPIVEHRENELLVLHEQIRLARDLGAKILRIFAAWRGVTYRNGLATYDIVNKYEKIHYPDVTRLEQWNWCKECIKEGAKYAEDYGITLALQNHAPLIRSYRDMLDMIDEVGSDYVKACLDAPLLTRQDDEFVVKAVRDVGDLQVHSHFGGEFERSSEGEVIQKEFQFGRPHVNYPVFIKTLKEIGYDGYICYEFCHPALTADHQPADITYVDEQVRYALEYMRKLL